MYLVYYKHTEFSFTDNDYISFWKTKKCKTKRECYNFARIYFEFHSGSWNGKFRKPSQKNINKKIYYYRETTTGYKKFNFLYKEL